MIKYLPPFDVCMRVWMSFCAHQSSKLGEREKNTRVPYTERAPKHRDEKKNDIEKIAHIDDTRAWRYIYRPPNNFGAAEMYVSITSFVSINSMEKHIYVLRRTYDFVCRLAHATYIIHALCTPI